MNKRKQILMVVLSISILLLGCNLVLADHWEEYEPPYDWSNTFNGGYASKTTGLIKCGDNQGTVRGELGGESGPNWKTIFNVTFTGELTAYLDGYPLCYASLDITLFIVGLDSGEIIDSEVVFHCETWYNDYSVSETFTIYEVSVLIHSWPTMDTAEDTAFAIQLQTYTSNSDYCGVYKDSNRNSPAELQVDSIVADFYGYLP
jgi:hypothetical protein